MKAKNLHFNYFRLDCFPQEFSKESSAGFVQNFLVRFSLSQFHFKTCWTWWPAFDRTERRRNNCRAHFSTPDTILDSSTNRKLSALSCSLMTGLPSSRVITFSDVFQESSVVIPRAWLKEHEGAIETFIILWRTFFTLNPHLRIHRPGWISITTRKNFPCLWPHFIGTKLETRTKRCQISALAHHATLICSSVMSRGGENVQLWRKIH